MKYTIIEDCSPYYIRFTWDGLPDLINILKQIPLEKSTRRDYVHRYKHYDFEPATGIEIINQLPMKDSFDFMKRRVSLFVTPPHTLGAPIHKDGADHRISINIPLEVHDAKCVTHWWRDESLIGFKQDNQSYTRKIVTDTPPLPDKTMVAAPNECLLFNTDIYHAWDNTNSSNQRAILTLRVENPGEMYFDDAKKILFGNVVESGLWQQS